MQFRVYRISKELEMILYNTFLPTNHPKANGLSQLNNYLINLIKLQRCSVSHKIIPTNPWNPVRAWLTIYYTALQLDLLVLANLSHGYRPILVHGLTTTWAWIVIWAPGRKLSAKSWECVNISYRSLRSILRINADCREGIIINRFS